MSRSLVGTWSARYREADGEPVADQRAHYVETEVEHASLPTVTTYCGRELEVVTTDGKARLWLADTAGPGAAPVERCETCLGGHPAAPTGLEDEP